MKGLRPMKSEDVEQVHSLLNKFLMKYELAPQLSLEEVKHWFIPIPNVVYSYVVEVSYFFSFSSI